MQEIVIHPVYSKPERPQLNSCCQVCTMYLENDLEQLEKDHQRHQRDDKCLENIVPMKRFNEQELFVLMKRKSWKEQGDILFHT